MISVYDYIVIGFFLLFMIGIGIYFRNTCKDTSDFIRGGGSMSWWLSGASNFMFTFSAWTFVGCAGKIYKTGTLLIILFFFNAFAYLVVGLFLAHRFRRMRVITPVEAIRQRFGLVSEQVYAWQGAIQTFLLGGVGLYTLSIFIAPILNVKSMPVCIAIMGMVIVFMSVTGGAWAVVASDFVQSLTVMAITIVAAVLVLMMPEVGGVSGFFEKLPSYHFNYSELMRPPIIFLWVFAIFLNQMFSAINLTAGASRYLYAKSDKDAKKSAFLVVAGFIVGPLLWFIPPMAASFVIPDIANMFPMLKNPEEASYVAICMKAFPAGLVGLLACGIFAATMSSMNTSLNLLSGIVCRNIYKVLFRPQADEKELLLTSRLLTLFFGASMITGGIIFASLKNTPPMFEFTMMIAGLISIPMTMPLVLGMFIKRTPPWSAWSTIVVGLSAAFIAKFFLSTKETAAFIGFENLSDRELSDFSFFAMIFCTSTVSTLWFLGMIPFYRKASRESQESINGFFANMDKPVTADSAEHRHTDAMQYRMLGSLCLAYGFVILLGTLIPNNITGRLCFMFIGGSVMVIGAVLYRLFLQCRTKLIKVEVGNE